MAFERIKRRQAKRRAEKYDAASLGGSKEAQRQLLGAAAEDRRQATQARVAGRKEIEGELEHARSDDLQRSREYQGSRLANVRDLDAQRGGVAGINQAAQGGMGILGAAGASNQLTGSTENVLAQRAAALGAAPSAQSLAEDAIAAQAANTRANTNFGQGQLARQAMGVAAGQGEGGALAAQQAIASLVGGGANLATQNNLAQAEAAANMRAQAAAQARGETLQSADLGAQARLQAAAAERANQLGIAQQQAGLLTQGAQATQNALQGVTGASQAAQNTQAAMAQQAQAQRSSIAEALGSQSNQAESTNRNYEASLLNAGADAATNALNAQGRTLAQKVFTPFGMLGN